jgi:hypothetical protein
MLLSNNKVAPPFVLKIARIGALCEKKRKRNQTEIRANKLYHMIKPLVNDTNY